MKAKNRTKLKVVIPYTSQCIKCHGKDFAHVIIFFVLLNPGSFSSSVYVP